MSTEYTSIRVTPEIHREARAVRELLSDLSTAAGIAGDSRLATLVGANRSRSSGHTLSDVLAIALGLLRQEIESLASSEPRS